MADMRYYGTYAKFTTKNKSEGSVIVGPDYIVGTPYSIDFVTEEGKTTAWAKNPYGNNIGFFDSNTTYRLNVFEAREWHIYALLSLVGFTDPSEEEDEGYYWGELAIFACPKRYEENVETFINKVAEKLADGIRPDIDLNSSAIDDMLEAKGDWLPDRNLPSPEKKKGTVILKRSQSMSEKAIEKGRKGNKGCYVISYLFIAVVIVAIVLIVKAILGW